VRGEQPKLNGDILACSVLIGNCVAGVLHYLRTREGKGLALAFVKKQLIFRGFLGVISSQSKDRYNRCCKLYVSKERRVLVLSFVGVKHFK
jgi:hypothetical protein